jgi:ubiquinone/menaquinone biosynthesis C-methylase UbiE
VIDPTDPAYAGQREFTPAFLRVYDALVLGFYCSVVWRCPAGRIVEQYARHVGRRHLDVGPGTGYFLERARLPVGAEMTLLDPNPHVLAHARRRLAGLRPAPDVSAIKADVLRPLPLPPEQRFDSAALSFVVHCLPGPMPRKAAAIRNVAAALEVGGVLFGATVLGTSARHTWLSRLALRGVNRRGIFSNLCDSEKGLRAILGESFEEVDIEIVGSAAVFAARLRRRSLLPAAA